MFWSNENLLSVVLLWMLLGLSWLGGIIQIAIDLLFNQRDDKKKEATSSSRELVDKATQSLPNFSVSLWNSSHWLFIVQEKYCEKSDLSRKVENFRAVDQQIDFLECQLQSNRLHQLHRQLLVHLNRHRTLFWLQLPLRRNRRTYDFLCIYHSHTLTIVPSLTRTL